MTFCNPIGVALQRARRAADWITAETTRTKDWPMTEKEVKVFSLSTCSHCKSTKKLLNECTVKYDFVDVDLLEGDERKAILEDVRKFNPKCSFPTVIIGEKVIVGYKEKQIKEALGIE
jgi:glutaredoxin-like protein NrdH